MERALRRVSVERGVDPRELALVAFGGAGPLHACGLADALEMPVVIVPPRAGVLSAVGLLCSPGQAHVVESWPHPGDATGLADAVDRLATVVRERMVAAGGVTVHTAVDCRYAGQSHELTVPDVASFHAEHERRNGFSRPGAPVEVVALRAEATTAPPLRIEDLPVPAERSAVVGPAVVADVDCTIWVPDGWRGDPGPLGSLLLTRTRR
jgi:N-methylhydantoinase A/oxoprolinase/acetone carboxylase beta subunit